jgi:alkaline phosphatase D
MTSSLPDPSRRAILKGAAIGAAFAVVPFRLFDVAAAEAPARKGIFGYGVASGDPLAHAIVLWTRATPPSRHGQQVATPGSGLGKPLEVEWELAADARFHHVVRHGTVWTNANSDHTVKVDVHGLSPYTRYWYRFRARGETSVVGRTQTAPDIAGEMHALRLALVSCSNYTGGFFGAYRAIGARDDLDFVLHVGDYIYEYPNAKAAVDGRYGPDALIGIRDSQPATETIDLTGYRLRHALHKADPDAALAHRQHPWITIFDDHEVANNTWATDAENHTPGVEGDFLTRRQEAYQAYLEWMPFRLPNQHLPHVGTRFFRRFTFGALGDLSVVETRQNRSRQVEFGGSKGGGFVPDIPNLAPQFNDPTRQLPEPEQMSWLQDGLAGRRPWHLVGNQVIFAPVRFPGALFGASGLFLNSDQWDGYQADQQQLVEHLAGLPAGAGDAVFLTGDIHSSWAMELPRDRSLYPTGGTSVGVEFVCPSVTSDGFYELATAGNPTAENTTVGLAGARGATAAVQATNPWIKYLDGVGHGFTIVDVTRERVQADFYLTPDPTVEQPDPRTSPTVEPALARSVQTLAGTHLVTAAAGPLGARADQPRQLHRTDRHAVVL